MKFETRTNEDGSVTLQLGLTNNVTFQPERPTPESICAGVENLIHQTIGISAFELVMAVVKEYNKKDG